jgi:hypothetical protein
MYMIVNNRTITKMITINLRVTDNNDIKYGESVGQEI